jgi:hypothetical protein
MPIQDHVSYKAREADLIHLEVVIPRIDRSRFR